MKATILTGDCREVLRTLAENSVDAVVTDPPYGLEFMGKDWDAPWKEQDSAGGKVSGFGQPDGTPFRHKRGTPAFGANGNPTCENCGGDKYRNGPRKCSCEHPSFPNHAAVQMRAFQAWCQVWATELLRVAKPGAYLLAFGGSRTYHRLTAALEDSGWEIRDTIMWIYGSGFPKSKNGEWGGTALKPAHEPIIMARKPLIGTQAANFEAHGTGGLNIAACRVPTSEDLSGGAYNSKGARSTSPAMSPTGMNRPGATAAGEFVQPPGRWPANVIHDGSDVIVGAFPDAPGQQGDLSNHAACRQSPNGIFGGMRPALDHKARSDAGSAARFFYCAKTTRADRNAGLGASATLAVGTNATMRDCEDADWEARNGNFHPTVKPTELMRYLCRLVTPAGGTVLDPFMGSGSTGRGAVLENRRFIGIEMDRAYAAIAAARIASAESDVAQGAAQADLFKESAA
ncbi:site-specific DNA-methyltransferase [Luteibacter aegosomaticola]|uniref:DNA-methyltransferase n=1 Tax=Luteibacter aegosomaticola TaxID=2911538 RepID=UPI001FFB1D8E|nr:site-specific DNA-methyltransferase [Luteibacter aegosomaticola]UPG89307.1 site-specific DNA-methyltransferase [Luteibacter aegosomaticola]